MGGSHAFLEQIQNEVYPTFSPRCFVGTLAGAGVWHLGYRNPAADESDPTRGYNGPASDSNISAHVYADTRACPDTWGGTQPGQSDLDDRQLWQRTVRLHL